MRIINNTVTTIIALVGVIGGSVWIAVSGADIEAIIVTVVSSLQIIAYVISKSIGTESTLVADDKLNSANNLPRQGVTNIISENDRQTIIEAMKLKLRVLFIDDDKNFNVVKILKNSGWRHVKTVTDIKHLDVPIVNEAQIFFVDVNGVGKLLNLEYEGLDLALMLKQKYPTRKVVIYSANKTSNAFHKAWDECDFKLEKNALPYQFQNLVEQFSIEIHQSK